MTKTHLEPGGVMTMWAPLYTTTPEAVKSQLATFFAAGAIFVEIARHRSAPSRLFTGSESSVTTLLAAMR